MLRDSQVAASVAEAFAAMHKAGQIRVDALVIMPDHYHGVFRLLSGELPSTMRLINGRASRDAGKTVGVRGLWQAGFYDRLLRDHDEYVLAVHYVHQNPVRAGLVQRAED